MAGFELLHGITDIGTRLVVAGSICWMCVAVGLYFWDECVRRHMVRRRSRELRNGFHPQVKPTGQANRWFLEDDLFAYRCQCGNLWFGDEQAGYSMGEHCPACDPARYADDVLSDRQNQAPTDEPQVMPDVDENVEDYYDVIAERSNLPERRRHAEEQGDYLQLAGRED